MALLVRVEFYTLAAIQAEGFGECDTFDAEQIYYGGGDITEARHCRVLRSLARKGYLKQEKRNCYTLLPGAYAQAAQQAAQFAR